MFIHPASKEIKTGVEGIDPKMIQPNTIDLRLKKVFRVGPGPLIVNEEKKDHRKLEEMNTNGDGYWELEPAIYQFESNQWVEIGEGELGLVIGRSTFNRNGTLILSSVYDSGFVDYVGATCYNLAGPLDIEVNTRFAHLILAKAETIGMYDGDYGGTKSV